MKQAICVARIAFLGSILLALPLSACWPHGHEHHEHHEAACKSGAVEFQTVPAVTALVITMSGSYDQHPDAIGQLYAYLGEKGVSPGIPFGIYFNTPAEVPEDSLKWMVGVEVPKGTEAVDPFEVRDFEEIETAAVMTCTGPYGHATPCYDAMHKWIHENGCKVAGPGREVWMDDFLTTAEEKLRAKIIYPVEKRSKETQGH